MQTCQWHVKCSNILVFFLLQQLLDIPAIHTSPEMVEFLALKGNANIAFVQASTSYAPKFDKVNH